MSQLVQTIANIIRQQVSEATKGHLGEKLESRFIFHGPSKDLLEQVFESLASSGGVTIPLDHESSPFLLPVLLPLPGNEFVGENPAIGCSGKCDESHLLDVRDHPEEPSFLALVPPGLHINASIDSTTGKLGVAAFLNARHIPFSQWWEDEFVQQLVKDGLQVAGFDAQELEDALQLVEHAAAALDEMDRNEGSRNAVWGLLSRIYSIPESNLGLSPGQALALACGLPPMQDGGIAPKQQTDVLGKIADELADGFNAGIERIAQNASEEVKLALDDFLHHVQTVCEVPTALERATEAFYLPGSDRSIQPPPTWWSVLTVECWSELISEETSQLDGDLEIRITNAILPVVRGIPALVRDNVELEIHADSTQAGTPIEVFLTGGSHGKVPVRILVDRYSEQVDSPPANGQKTPFTYKVESERKKPASAKVISLESWSPGIVVTCRMVKKLSPPKKLRKPIPGIDWETSLSLPGSGRYELLIFIASGMTVTEVAGTNDDAAESLDEGRKALPLQELRDGGFMVEVEAEDKYQVDISFRTREGEERVCRAYILFEETKTEGCRSEFERLIKCNRKHLERFDTKAVVQLDRYARLSSLQAWMLDEQNIHKSFFPIVFAEDYASTWAPPDWEASNGPVLSKARFLQDPRPPIAQFRPPTGFIEARTAIAQRVRESTEDQSGLVESTRLGKLLSFDEDFRTQVEIYLETYSAWLEFDYDVACWCDVIAICPREGEGRSLSRIPDAIILSPLHPLRFAWHCFAQQALYQEGEGGGAPCPAASVLDPDCIPDILTLSLQSPSGPGGLERVDFLSLECSSDYWSVLWNGARLSQLHEKSRQAPFDSSLGLDVGGISSGFSPAQVARALEDVTNLLVAKPSISVAVSSSGSSTDACNDGLMGWCAEKFGKGDKAIPKQGVGPRVLEVYDTRASHSHPDQASIANLSEDTDSRVRWFEGQPEGSSPDLGIIAQLQSTEPALREVGVQSPIGIGGLIRHRIRRQLQGAFLCESRQAMPVAHTAEPFAKKITNCLIKLESENGRNVGLVFAPNVHAITSMLEERKAAFVAVSSSAIDPACFLGGWIEGTYLWDYDLPSYSHRAGDVSGYYLLSQIKDADKDKLLSVLERLPGVGGIPDDQVEEILLEVARRGIPTIRGLSGDDTGATGDLGLFIAVRLLQDQFRPAGNMDSLLPVLAGSEEEANLAIIVPIDPFRCYLADLAQSLRLEGADTSLSRPDLLVVGIRISEGKTNLHLTPIEVKFRQDSTLGRNEARDALGQAKALTSLLRLVQDRASSSVIWTLALQHLLLSMIGFGFRVYSRLDSVIEQGSEWDKYHALVASAILGTDLSAISIDNCGRLVVVDNSPESEPRDNDDDDFDDTIVISATDAGRIVAGNAQVFYNHVRSKIGDWALMPKSRPEEKRANSATNPESSGEDSTEVRISLPETTLPDNTSSLANILEDSRLPGGNSAGSSDEPKLTTSARTGVILSVGQTVSGFEPRHLALNISNTRLNQLNIGVVGDLGTGKTQLLKSLIYQITTSGPENKGIKPRFLIFDYKRDYSSPDFVAATGAKVIKPSRLPLNLFDTTTLGESMAPWLDRFRFFSDVLDKVYSGIGPVQRDKLKGAVRSAYESCGATHRQPTIYDIHSEYRSLLGGKSDSPMAIIDDLVDMGVFEPDYKKTIPFNDFLDGIVVISLDAMGQDDRSKNMLVAIMLNMFYENMLRTPKRPFEGTEPQQLRVLDSYLLVDEADNIMRYEFDVLRKLLLQGREFGVGVILASQYLRHFKVGATDYREPLLTWFIHKVPNVTAAELGALGFTSDLGELSERVKSLPNHHCLYKSYDVPGEVIRGLPFYQLPITK